MKICVPIKEKSLKLASKALLKASQEADMAELWADQLEEGEWELLLKEKPCEVLVTFKKPLENGVFMGSDEQLANHLIRASHLGAEYIDIPFTMPSTLNKKIVHNAREAGSKILISHHDYQQTPSLEDMLKMADQMTERGADVVKIATMARSLDDMVAHTALATLLKSKGQRHCLIAMGNLGQLSRILTPTLGGELMFAVLSKKKQTATGQMTVNELKSAWNLIESK